MIIEHKIRTKEIFVVVDAIARIVLAYKRGCIVEIGSSPSLGGGLRRTSSGIFLDLCKDFGVKYYSCDHMRNRDLKTGVPNHIHFVGKSFGFMKQFDGRPSIVLLDGDHDYDVVIKEANFFLERMNTGGVLFMHDTMPLTEDRLKRHRCSDSYKVRQEFEKKVEEFDTFTWFYTANDAGLTMIMKKQKDRPYYRR